MASKRIVVPLAPGFEEIEAVAIIDVLRRAEFDVVVAGVGGDSPQRGAHGLTIAVDASLDRLSAEDFDLVVLPGGMPGAANLAESRVVIEFLQGMASADKLVGAICAAPMVLGAAGLLEGRRYTVYPGFEERIHDGQCTEARTEKDGRILTGRGPGTAIEFALMLVRELGYPEVADALQEGMLVAAPA